MNNEELLSYSSIEDEACAWVARLDRGLNSEEEQGFLVWLNTTPTHNTIFYGVASYWDESDVLSKLAKNKPLIKRNVNEIRVSKFLILPVAASALLMMLTCFFGLFRDGLGHEYSNGEAGHYAAEFSTGVGEHLSAPLPDGSVLTVNTDSDVSISFEPSIRKIKLLKGELHIEVAHDEGRPLFVFAGDNWVRAVGTAFNVRLRTSDTLEVTVSDGVVIVSGQDIDFDEAIRLNSEYENIDDLSLRRGDVAVIDGDRHDRQSLSISDVNRTLSWMQGNLVFTGETLQDVLVEIERYTPVRFEVSNDKLKNVRVVGVFQAGDVDGFLASIDENLGVRNIFLSRTNIRLEKN